MTYSKDTAIYHYKNNLKLLSKKKGYEKYKKDVKKILSIIRKKKGGGIKYEKPLRKLIEKIITDKTNLKPCKGTKISIDLFGQKYEPILDLVFEYKNKKILIELKGWIKDTNSFRSVILQSILIKKFPTKEFNNSHIFFYYVGNKDSKKNGRSNVFQPLLKFSESKKFLGDKKILDGIFCLSEIDKLVKDIIKKTGKKMRISHYI